MAMLSIPPTIGLASCPVADDMIGGVRVSFGAREWRVFSPDGRGNVEMLHYRDDELIGASEYYRGVFRTLSEGLDDGVDESSIDVAKAEKTSKFGFVRWW